MRFAPALASIFALSVFTSACVLIPYEEYHPKEEKLVEDEAEDPSEEVFHADCKRVKTGKNVQDYYFCLGPLAYCWIGARNGISCTPK